MSGFKPVSTGTASTRKVWVLHSGNQVLPYKTYMDGVHERALRDVLSPTELNHWLNGHGSHWVFWDDISRENPYDVLNDREMAKSFYTQFAPFSVGEEVYFSGDPGNLYKITKVYTAFTNRWGTVDLQAVDGGLTLTRHYKTCKNVSADFLAPTPKVFREYPGVGQGLEYEFAALQPTNSRLGGNKIVCPHCKYINKFNRHGCAECGKSLRQTTASASQPATSEMDFTCPHCTVEYKSSFLNPACPVCCNLHDSKPSEIQLVSAVDQSFHNVERIRAEESWNFGDKKSSTNSGTASPRRQTCPKCTYQCPPYAMSCTMCHHSLHRSEQAGKDFTCPHCTFKYTCAFWNPTCQVCGNRHHSALASSSGPPTTIPTRGEQDKILLARERLLQLADIVQERLAVGESSDPVDHFIRLRAAELDLHTCWEILQQFDHGAQDWLSKTHAYQLIKNPQVPPDSTPTLLQPEDEEEKKEEEDPEETEKVVVPKNEGTDLD